MFRLPSLNSTFSLGSSSSTLLVIGGNAIASSLLALNRGTAAGMDQMQLKIGTEQENNNFKMAFSQHWKSDAVTRIPSRIFGASIGGV